MRNFKKLLVCVCLTLSMGICQTAQASPFLAIHIFLNSLASKYLPGWQPSSAQGPYVAYNHGFLYEQGSAYKTGSGTRGSGKPSMGLDLGYLFLRSESHQLGIEVFRKYINFQADGAREGEDVVDGGGLRLTWGVLGFKAGYSVHRFDLEANHYDAGFYTGFGLEFGHERWSVFLDLTSHHLVEHERHMAGIDLGLRYYFGDGT